MTDDALREPKAVSRLRRLINRPLCWFGWHRSRLVRYENMVPAYYRCVVCGKQSEPFDWRKKP